MSAGEERVELICEDGGVFDRAVPTLAADGIELLFMLACV